MTVTAMALAFALVSGQSSPRDARTATPPASGTATISGVVVTDDTERRPLRRARVTVMTSDRAFERTVITDDSGTFAFKGLPGGRYTLSVIKPGYVTLAFGAKRPNRPGTPIALTDAQQLRGVSLRMQRASVITGTILDQNGSPASGMFVSVLRYGFVNGERKLTPATSSREGQGTDDRGAYRIYGLSAGEYVVTAAVSSFAIGRPEDQRIMMTDAEVRAALDLLRAQGAAGAPPRPGAVIAPPNPPVTVGYAPVFYPGTTNASQAALVSVGVGEERSGIDFQLQLVPTAKVEGTLLLPDGNPVGAGTITMVATGQTAPAGFMFDTMKTARPDREGRFAFSGVTPGQYAIVSRGSLPGAAPAPLAPGTLSRTPPLWAVTDVTVEGQNVSGLILTLQNGMTVSGRIVLEGSTLAPPPLARLTVNLTAPQNEVSLGVSAAQVDANGLFTISGVTPGRYRLSVTIPGARPDTPGAWVMKSATIEGQETLDAFYALRRSVDAAVITLTDTPTELAGAVQDAAGQPAPEHQIIVFSADKQYWTPQSRRIQSVRPASSGKYIVRNLPLGEYYLAAVIDAEPGEWFDPAFLQQLTSGAFRITLSDGEKKTQDVRVGGGF
jgi:hypothetical protein